MSAAVQPLAQAVPRRSWSARLFSLPVVLGLGLLATLVFLTGAKAGHFGTLADPDIWWHLRNAGQLVQTGHFVRTDGYSFTTAGKPWVDFEWGGELPYYFGYRWLGLTGLYVVTLLAAGATFLGMYGLGWLRSGDPKAAFLAAFIGFHFITVSMGPRTLLFGWICLIVELGILWSLEKGRDYTAWLPALFLVWANMHGSWLIGFVMMVLFFACGLVKGEWGALYAQSWTAEQKRKFVLVTVASFALLFVNPYGWRLVIYPIDAVFHNKLGVGWIVEWFSLDFHTARGKIVLATLFGMGVLQLVRQRRWSLQDLALVLLALYSGLTYVRFVFLAGLVVMPLLAIDLRGLVLDPYDAEKDRRAVNAVALAVLAVLVAGFWPTGAELRSGIRENFPEKALPYVRSLADQGPFFNAYQWGGYLELYAPERAEFVDSRVDVFAEAGVMDDYLKAIQLKDTYGVLDKYGIRYVLLEKKMPMTYLLEHGTGWKRSYDDGQAVVFVREH